MLMWRQWWIAGVGVAVLLLAMAGCRTARQGCARPEGEMSLPSWFTQPSPDMQSDTPVSIGMVVPPHMASLQQRFALPGWVIYGVVRSVGATEFLVNGTVRVFTISDDHGESRVVVDTIHYDVSPSEVNGVLARIASDCVAARNELERHNVLGRYVRRRFGGMLLFSLQGAGPDGATSEKNLLLVSGASKDPVESFRVGQADGYPVVGWRETPAEYMVTSAGDFRFGDPIGSLRKVEEDAIEDLAKGLVLQFSHMQKDYTEAVARDLGDYKEETSKEEVRLRMRGLKVTRRMVRMDRGECFVTVVVAKDGVALR